jgi:hypothetical protein
VKELIIDENYEGIIDEGYRYVCKGSISFDFSIIVSLEKRLYVEGYIQAGKWIKAGESIQAGKWIKAGEWIQAGGSIKAMFIMSFGHKGLKLIFINGLKYNIWRWGSMLKIGCKRHTIEEWKNFDDKKIKSMDSGALDWWSEHKTWILNLLPNEKEIIK